MSGQDYRNLTWPNIPIIPSTAPFRDSLRKLVLIVERGWKAEGWNCAENSGQVPLDELEARNEARRLLGEPFEPEPR